jgi:hypothetical protein
LPADCPLAFEKAALLRFLERFYLSTQESNRMFQHIAGCFTYQASVRSKGEEENKVLFALF